MTVCVVWLNNKQELIFIVNFWLGQPMCRMHSCPTTKDISVAIPVIDETKSIYVPKEECAACMPLSYLK